MLQPLPTQLSGANWLASKSAALLADEQRVGKTGTAIIAADYVLAEKILIVTTASGRPVWRRGIEDWSAYDRRVQVVSGGAPLDSKPGVMIVGWPSITEPKTRSALLRREWDVIILDESHYAKNIEAKRTAAVYGEFPHGGRYRTPNSALVDKAAHHVWCLTGTPIPNAPNDLYPMLRALAPERLEEESDYGWPDVTTYAAFLDRYCVTRPKRISQFRSITIVMGGRNLPELRDRLRGFILRRTQAEVGITPPIYETLPLLVSPKMRREADSDLDRSRILAAAETGDTKSLEMHLGPLRRLTGEIKARAVVDAVKDEFDCGLDKIVLMGWHTETLRILAEGLAIYGVVGLDGSTPPARRDEAVERFRTDPKIRIFIGQIIAAGEAIDLSVSATLWFVESSFTPKDMAQAAMRITNYGQRRQPVVRVATLEGSIDEALQAILLRKWTSIREVLS